jgi:NAD(P)-dependent dehydrogenase (short-subunit alcohol dehydrogenase family)
MILKDKVAIVTGAKQGIGLGIALELAKEGANVVVSDLDQAGCDKVVKQIEAVGVISLAVKCDVSVKAEVDNLVVETINKFGKVDILVNNAGIFPFKPFLQMTEEEWEKVINVNLKSVFLCSQAVANEMNDGGKIVNVSSIAAFVGFEGLVHYCASKGGINAMIRALALELANKKINVNAVAPGATNTPGASGGNVDMEKQIIAQIPLARKGEPKDIADAVVFLASNKADYITGQTIIVDGGWTLR